MRLSYSILLVISFWAISALAQVKNNGNFDEVFSNSKKIGLEDVQQGRQIVNSWIRRDNNYALELGLKLNELSSPQNNPEIQMIGMLALGQAYEGVSDHKKAIKVYEQVLNLYSERYNVQLQIDALCGLARAHSDGGNHTAASQNFTKAARVVESTNDPVKIADVYVLIAEFYRETQKYEYALNYLNKVRAYVSQGNTSQAAEMEMYSRFAAVWNEFGQNRDSIPIVSKICIQLGQEYGDEHVVATAQNELGYYYGISNPQLSIDYYNKAITIWKKLNYIRYEAHCALNLIRQHSDRFSKQELIALLNDLINRIGDRPWYLKRSELHEMVAARYEETGDLKNALAHFREYLVLHEKHQNLTNQRELDEIQEKYEVERNLRTISEQREEIDFERREKLESESKASRYFWMSLLLTLLVLGGVYTVYRIRKSNKLLHEQKLQIEGAKARLEELLSSRELLLKEIHHRVKNNLQMVISLLELQSLVIKDEETKVALQSGNQRVKSMALVHKRLYQNKEFGYVELQGYIQSLLLEIDAAYTSQDRSVETKVESNGITLDVDTIIPFGLILTELVTNSYKHANANPLEIQVLVNELDTNKFELIYRDNGPGVPDDFEPKKTRSLGMKVIKRLTQQLNGRFSFVNENGLKVIIQFDGTIERKKIA